MQNATLRTATGCIQYTNIQHLDDETLILPLQEHLQLHVSQYKHKTQHPSHPLHKHTAYFNTPRLKHTIFNNGRYTNMCHIHTSIVSMHIATRGNNKILRTPPPHISNSEEVLSRLTRRTLNSEQINHPSSNHTYTVDAKIHHYHFAPFVTLTYTTHIISSTAPHCHPLDLWTDPARVAALLARWTEKLAARPQGGRSDSTPQAMDMGVGIQQAHLCLVYIVLGGYLRILGAPIVQSCCTLLISASYLIFFCNIHRKSRLVYVWLSDLDLSRHRPLL